MRTMILLLMLYGNYPIWLQYVVSIWWVLSCAKWWFRVWYEYITGTVIGTTLGGAVRRR